MTDPCKSYNALLSDTALFLPQCTLYKDIAQAKLDSSAILTIDCLDEKCKYSVSTLSFTSDPYAACKVYDTYKKEYITLKDIGSMCENSIVVTTSVPNTVSPIASYTLTPSSKTSSPQSLDTDSSNGSTGSNGISTGTIIIIAAGVLLLILIVFFAVIYRRRQKRFAANAPIDPHANQTNLTMPYVRVDDNTNQTTHSSARPSAGPRDLKYANNQPGSTFQYPSSTNYPVPCTMTSSTQNQSQSGALDLCDLDLYRVNFQDVAITRPLAEGAYGEVLLGNYMNQQVAIKRLLPSKKASISELQKFILEIKLLSKIDCIYVVHFIGVAWSKPADMMLLTEYMEGGDLRQVLDSNPKNNNAFSWTQKLHCALNVAEGLVYLHSMDPRVIHRDLKSRNVLLDSRYNAKITDFGIARETDDATMTAGIGTYRWMAPEVLKDGHYSELADIFSFGVVLSELCTEIVPYSDLRNATGRPYTDTAVMARVMNGELKPTFSKGTPLWYVALAHECLSLSPSERPSATYVAYQIRTQIKGFI